MRKKEARESRNTVLLTGATGFVGKVVLHELMRRRQELGIERVVLLVRARRGVSAQKRFFEEIVASPCFRDLPKSWPDLVEILEGDIAEDQAGIGGATRIELTQRLTQIIHCAASVEFDLPIGEATALNVTGSLNLLELAAECRKRPRMVDVSTAYVTPHAGDDRVIEEALFELIDEPEELYDDIREGRFDGVKREAALLAKMGHPNTYTFSKCLAENLLAARREEVPLSIVRPSIVSASLKQPFAGWIDSPAAFALFALMIGSGRMRAMIGRCDARIDTVPVDYVADQILRSTFPPRLSGSAGYKPAGDFEIVHAVAGRTLSPRLDTCTSHLARFFSDNRPPGAEGLPIGIRYLGPDGFRFRVWHLYLHWFRAEGRAFARRLAGSSRNFSYFTQNTFDFESSRCRPQIQEQDYLETICRGVFSHLMRGEAVS